MASLSSTRSIPGRLFSPIIALMVATVLVVSVPEANAQKRGNEEPRVSPNASVSQTIGTTKVTLTYGRPKVKGRTIFGGLVPYGKVWRTGANEATTITFSDPVLFEGQRVDAGTYSLFTIPGEDQWTIILNDVAQQWGAYDYNSEEDVVRVKVNARSADVREMMTFLFENVDEASGTLVLHWAQTRVPISIEVAS